MRSDDPVGSRYRLELAQRIVRLLLAGQKPSVAAVEGHALGGGLALALACDMVVAHPKTVFGASQSRVGLMPDDMALLWTLPQRVGMGKAKQIMMVGKPFNGGRSRRPRLGRHPRGEIGRCWRSRWGKPSASRPLHHLPWRSPRPPALARATDLESAFARWRRTDRSCCSKVPITPKRAPRFSPSGRHRFTASEPVCRSQAHHWGAAQDAGLLARRLSDSSIPQVSITKLRTSLAHNINSRRQSRPPRSSRNVRAHPRR